MKEKEFWDELKEFQSKTNSDKSSIEDFSFVELSFDKDNLEEYIKVWEMSMEK